MEDEHNDIEDEMDKLDEEIKEDAKVAPVQKPKGKTVEAAPQATERYSPFYQEARIGIMDNVTNEVVVEGLTDLPTAGLEAFKLNKLDKIEIASGA